MITKVTKDNKGLYRALFDRATTDLALAHPGESAITITSLDDYFLSIKDLTELNGGDNTYAILPLDEPFFEINANTRVISVPPEFKAHGISVKGDQIAEILFFTIDRYYDTVDLFDPTVKIFIQCEDPSGKQHVYREFLRDVSLLKSQGKMVFGWTVDNKITQQAGTLKFSVRFIITALNENEEKEIIFSLSTLTANATINPGLDFTFDGDSPEAELIDNKNIMKKRIINSSPTEDSGDVDIATPVFFIDIPTKAADIFLSETQVIDETTYEFKNVDLDNEGHYQFSVMATSEDGGLITYNWYRAGLGSNLSSYDSLNARDEYVITEDTEWGSEHPYYTKTEINGTEAYVAVQVTQSMIGEEISEEEGPFYEKRSVYVAGEVGDYWVVAKNRIGNSIKEATSTYVRIPGPKALRVAVGGNLEQDEDTGIFHVYLDSEGEFELTATGTTARIPEVGNAEEGAAGYKITYTWKEIPEAGDPIIKASETKNNNVSSSFSEEIAQEDIGLFDKTYKVSVIASRNGSSTPQPEEKVFRVTDQPHAPIVYAHEQEATIRGVNGTVELSIDIDLSSIIYDTLTYQWYYITLDPEDDDFEIPGATDPVITVDAQNSYYCIVTNHINGDSASSARPDPENPSDRGKYTSVSKLV